MSELNIVSTPSENKKPSFGTSVLKTIYSLFTTGKPSVFSRDEWKLLLNRWDEIFVEGSDMTGRQTFWRNFIDKCQISSEILGQEDIDIICALVQKSKQQQFEQGNYLSDTSLFDFLQNIHTRDQNTLAAVINVLVKEGCLQEGEVKIAYLSNKPYLEVTTPLEQYLKALGDESVYDNLNQPFTHPILLEGGKMFSANEMNQLVSCYFSRFNTQCVGEYERGPRGNSWCPNYPFDLIKLS